jgi:hypothetical protein
MPFTKTERSVCNKLTFDFDSITAPVKASKGEIRNSTSFIESLLNTTSFSSESTINSAIQSLAADVDSNLPTTSELQELSNLLNNCAYFQDLTAIATVAGSINSAVEKIDSLVGNIGTTLPEFNLGNYASRINDLLFGNIPGSSQISNLLRKSDKLINCLSSYCGGEYPTQVSNFTTTVNELYDDLNVVNNPLDSNYGKYNMQSLYDVAKTSPANQAKVNNITTSIDATKTIAIVRINSVLGGIKNNIGDLF